MWLENISFLSHESDTPQGKSLFKTALNVPPPTDTHLDQQFTSEFRVQPIRVAQASPGVHYPQGRVLAEIAASKLRVRTF